MTAFLRITGILALSGFAVQARAGTEPLFAPVPAWVKPLSLPVDAASNSAATLLFDQQVKIDRVGTVNYTEIASRIASAETLIHAANLQLPWNPDKGDLTVHRLEIIRLSGNIDVLKSGQKFAVLRREAQLERLQVNGQLTATMQIEGAQVGDIIRLAFSISYSDPAWAGHANGGAIVAFGKLKPVQSQVRAIWSDGNPVKWRVSDSRIKPTVRRDGGMTELVISGTLPEPLPVPDDAPARFRSPSILQVSNFADWKAVSAINAKLYEPSDAVRSVPDLLAEVERIAGASRDPKMRAAMALQLVQDKVRYLFNGMSFGSYVPAAVTETWTRKFGDCKGKTLLLLAILRELGVEAEPILVSATARDAVGDFIPGFTAFDHIVVRARVDDKWLWLDGTSLGDRIDDLGDIPDYGYGLPVRPGGAELEKLVATPASRPQSVLEFDYDMSAGLHFPALYTVRNTLRGPEIPKLRLLRDQLDPAGRASLDKKAVEALVPDSAVLEHSLIFNDQTGEAVLTGRGIVDLKWEETDGRESFLPGTMLSEFALVADRAGPEKAAFPVATGFPMFGRRQVQIKLPNAGVGFGLTGQKSHSATIGGVEMQLDAAIKGGVLTLVESQKLLVPELPSSALPEARAELAKAQAAPLKIEAAADYPSSKAEIDAAKKDGRLAALRAAFASYKPLSPDDVDPYLYRGRFHALLGETKLALEDVDKLVEKLPIIENHLWRAELRAKTDTASALKDVAAARALDPRSVEAVTQLVAIHQNRKDVPAALAAIDAAMDTGPDKVMLLRVKAEVLAGEKRVDEALASLDTAIGLSPGKPELLNERCWMKATNNIALDTALRDCTKAIDLMEDPFPALDSRGFVYLRMNRYDEAIEDFNASLKKNSKLAESLFARGIAKLRKGDKSGGDTDVAAARKLDPEIDATYKKYGVVP